MAAFGFLVCAFAFLLRRHVPTVTTDMVGSSDLAYRRTGAKSESLEMTYKYSSSVVESLESTKSMIRCVSTRSTACLRCSVSTTSTQSPVPVPQRVSSAISSLSGMIWEIVRVLAARTTSVEPPTRVSCGASSMDLTLDPNRPGLGRTLSKSHATRTFRGVPSVAYTRMRTTGYSKGSYKSVVLIFFVLRIGGVEPNGAPFRRRHDVDTKQEARAIFVLTAHMLGPTLAAKLAQKRKNRDEDGCNLTCTQHAKLELFDTVDGALVQDLLERGTQTSIRKLKRLGLLESGETLDELKEAFAEYVAGGEPVVEAGEDGEGIEGIEGAVVDASKAYESLVVSLASRSRDHDLRGAVLETYGGAVRGLAMAESGSDGDSDSVSEAFPDEHGAGNDVEEWARQAYWSKGGSSNPSGAAKSSKHQNHAVAATTRKALQIRNFMSEQMELSVEDVDDDAALAARRRELRAAEGPGLQPWGTAVADTGADGNARQNRASGSVARGATLMVSEASACPCAVSDVLADYGVKARVAARWKAVHESGGRDHEFGDFESHKQAVMFALMNSYMDVLYPLHRYPTEAVASDPIMDAALLHIINHIVASGDVIKKNNSRLEKNGKGGRSHGGRGKDSGNGTDSDGDEDIVCRDQGFVRPKVLILAPYRHHAKSIIDRLIQLAIQETRTDTVKNRARFEEEYGMGEEDDGLISERERVALSLKPKQHRVLFDGNCDDHFRMGIKMTRGSIRLFTDFYDSDILVASPLALSTRLEEMKKGEPDPKDFLSSIEISVLYRADALLMQNVAHVIKIYDSLNAIPKQQHNSDILRVRDWYLANRARAYRQNILLSSFESPEMKSLFSRYCFNHAGIARWKVAHRGVLGNTAPGVKHVFDRLNIDFQGGSQGKGKVADKTQPSGTKDEAEVRFENFITQVWPKIREASMGQLVFVPSYFDLVRVRNFLRKEAASFVVLSEYTTPQDMSRARNYFNDGRRRVLLYTERCHFYNRHRIRGIKDIYFYQLPEHQQYYAELANFIDDATMSTINVVYTKRDIMRLERVVGTKRAKNMMGSAKSLTVFV